MEKLGLLAMIPVFGLAGLPTTSATAASQETFVDENASADDIARSFLPEGLIPEGANLAAPPVTKGLKVVSNPPCSSLSNSVSVRVNFAFNSDQLDARSQHFLSEVAQAMKKPLLTQCNFLVIGHTDAKGSDQYNQILSERRAASVSRFLASQQVEPERLHPMGKGEQEPITSNPYSAENRRVQFAIASEETQ
jgi:OOP family OmpA-OmpF porin